MSPIDINGNDADPKVGWRFWRWPDEIRRLRRSQLSLAVARRLRTATSSVNPYQAELLNAMHIRAGIAEGWIVDGGDTALIDITR